MTPHRYGLRAVAAGAAALAMVAVSTGTAVADSIRDRQWHLSTLDVAQTHRISRGAGVTVAVIDTGVDAKHRDLAGAVLPGEDLLGPEAGDGTGRDDLDGHGTAMAGIIAGRGHGRGAGILGVAPRAKILPIRAVDNFFQSTRTLSAAVHYAVVHHADVINMSFTGGGDTYLADAIGEALAADIVVVAGSGNHSTAAQGLYPGAYPEVLTVGAVGRSGKIASLSVTGPQVDLVAPGVDIASTGVNNSGYALTSGTSDATAVVSGAAALIRARYPDLSAAEVVHRLTDTATDAGAKGRDDTYGHGRLDLVKALTADVPATTVPVAPSRTTTAPAPASVAGSPQTRVAVALGLAALVALVGVALAVLVARRRR